MAKSPRPRTTLADRVRRQFKDNRLCTIAFDELEKDDEVQMTLEDGNRMAIDRMGYSDHGHIHSLIVVKHGMKIFQELTKSLKPTIVQEDTGTIDDAQLIVLMGCYLHDIGMVVSRDNHDIFSVVIAKPILERILSKVYPGDIRKQVHVRDHVLHAVYCHDISSVPLTVEAGIVGIADALDMTRGRARIPFEAGSVNIHSASAMAIEEVKVGPGEHRTVRIEVIMSNASGIFQIQELLEKKVRSSEQIMEHIELYATMSEREDTILDKQLRVL